MKIIKHLIILFSLSALFAQVSFAVGIKERFAASGQLTYKVYFNGMSCGSIIWKYLGEEKVEDKIAQIVSQESNTKVMGVFDFGGNDKVYLEKGTFLPIKVERDLSLFGNKEKIVEYYDQVNGKVRVVKTASGKTSEIVLNQDKPIRHIMALLYFFPDNVELKDGYQEVFNLPTQKLTIRYLGLKDIKTGSETKHCYFLKGTGARSFNLWLDKETRLPLRLEFFVMLGKVSIVKQ
jgi:hypothetical protein